MSLDWDYCRKDFISYMHDNTHHILASVEQLTPIEKITGIVLFYCQTRYGTQYFSYFPQKKLGKYTADFMVVATHPSNRENNLLIVIECDGHDFHEKTKDQASKDKERDRFMTVRGFKVLRYTGSDIVNNPNIISKDIDSLVSNFFKE